MTAIYRSTCNLVLGLALLVFPRQLEAETPFGRGATLRVGAGGGQATTHVAEAENSKFGPVVGLQGGVALHRVQILGDLTLQAYNVANPLRAESFKVVYALASIQAQTDDGLYARVGIGPSFFRYSGPDVFVKNDTSIGYGATVGYALRREHGLRPGIEGLIRWAHSSDGELSARLIALQVTASWYRSRSAR